MPRRDLQALAGVTALAAILRFATLDVQSYWFDEAVTVGLLDMPFGDMLEEVPDSESTPPLYYVVAWLWAELFGTGEVGLRSLSALAGTATVPVAYLIAAQVASRRAALMTAALVAVNPLLVWYSQEARAYALLVLLSALSLHFFLRARDDRRALAWWAIVSAFALATHYFAAFVVVPEAAWLLWRRRAIAAVAATALAGLALLPLALDQASNRGAEFIEGSGLLTRIGQVPKQFLIGFDAPAEIATTLVAAGLVLVGLVMFVRMPRDELVRLVPVAGIAGFALFVPIALAIAGVDFLIARNLIAGLVPTLVVVAAGFAASRAGLAAGVALCVLSVGVVIAVAVEPDFQRDDWRGAAEAVGPVTEPRAVVITPVGGCVPLQIYLEHSRLIPEEGFETREIVLLGLAQRRPGEEKRPPRQPPHPPYSESFREVERIEEATFTLIRYRTDRPTMVFRGPLQATGLGGLPSVLVQEPGAATRACRRVEG